MRKSILVLAGLLAIVALAAAAGSCGSFTFDNNWDGNCFGCAPVDYFSRTYVFTLVPGGTAGSGATYYAYDAGTGTNGHRIFNIIKLYDKQSAVATTYVATGDGPKGQGTYDVMVVDQLTPHINTEDVFDVAGF
jgi:hypothetical protein